MTEAAIIEFAERQGNAKFRGYVQRVAFSLTLSEPMIASLKAIRDYPPHKRDKWLDEMVAFRQVNQVRAVSGYRQDMWIVAFRSLESRGLAYFNPAPNPSEPSWGQEHGEGRNEAPNGHLFYRLTRAGELTCELLVEAGLMTPAPKRRKVSR